MTLAELQKRAAKGLYTPEGKPIKIAGREPEAPDQPDTIRMARGSS